MTYQDDLKEIEDKMIGLARTMRGAQGKDRSLFVLSATVRRLRRLLRAMEHELDWAVTDFLDGWPGTPEGYNSLERGMIFNRPSDHDRYEQDGSLQVVDGAPEWVEENTTPIPAKLFKDRDTNEYAYSKALKNAKEIMERGYKEADDASQAVAYSYSSTQVVTEDQLLTWYHRGRGHQDEIALKEARQRVWDESEAQHAQEQAEARMPKEGWSIFDWETGERVGPATNQQYMEWTRRPSYEGQPGPPDEPILISREDPSEFIERGWRRDSRKVKEGRKWVHKLSAPYSPPDQRPVRVGQNELQEVSSDEGIE
jgi:hypothetical protein